MYLLMEGSYPIIPIRSRVTPFNRVIDLYSDDWGKGYFTGFVYIDNIPKQAEVQIWHVESKTYVKSVMTDVSGQFYVDGIKENEIYDLIAVDPDGEWEKKVSSKRTPEVMP